MCKRDFETRESRLLQLLCLPLVMLLMAAYVAVGLLTMVLPIALLYYLLRALIG